MASKDFSYALAVGSVLKGGKYDYTVESVLGKGGFGFTYLVSAVMKIDNIEMKVYFAVKEHFVSSLSSRHGGGSDVESSEPVRVQVEGSLKDFRGEARRLKELAGKNANIVCVNETFDANNTAYYVMEYVDGKGLNEIISESGAIPEARALEWMKAIISAVITVHDARMTHLDIKPANILISRDAAGNPRPVLIDFGLAKHYDKDGNATSTLNTVGCSDGYAPIEQYGGLKTFSPTADVYALGATLFAMLTGTKPPTASEVEPAELEAELRARGVSPATTAAVLKAMEYKAGERFPSAEAFMATLPDGVTEATLIIEPREIPVKPSPVTPKQPSHSPENPEVKSEKKVKKINWKLIGTILAIIIVGGIVWKIIDSSSSKESGVIPDPVYNVSENSVEEDTLPDYGSEEEKLAARVDFLIRQIYACSTLDELQELATNSQEFFNSLPSYYQNGIQNAAQEVYISLNVPVAATDSVAVDYDYDDYDYPEAAAEAAAEASAPE